MAFISYIVKSEIILFFLWAYYELVLKKQTAFQLNRIYLLGALLFAVGIPFIHLSYPFLNKVPPIYFLSYPSINVLEEGGINETSPTALLSGPVLFRYLFYFYLCGVIVFSIRYLNFWIQIFKFSSLLPHKKIQGLYIYLLPESVPAFSLFHHLFFNPQGLDKKSKLKIIEHEKVHIRQLHSLDIQISEIICILNWFNPFVWIFKQLILQNHEYLADQKVVQQFQTSNYLQLLVSQNLKGKAPFRNYFSCSNLKRRVQMITQANSHRYKLFSYVLSIFLSGILFFSSTSLVIGRAESGPLSAVPFTENQLFSTLFPIEENTTGPVPLIKMIRNGLTESLSLSTPANSPLIPTQSSDISLSKEKMPQFGEDIIQWINARIQYPEAAQTMGLKGKVYVHFIIDKNGEVKDVTLVRKSPYEIFNTEALRVIKSMPKWKSPGKVNGKPVHVSYTIPINFI